MWLLAILARLGKLARPARLYWEIPQIPNIVHLVFRNPQYNWPKLSKILIFVHQVPQTE